LYAIHIHSSAPFSHIRHVIGMMTGWSRPQKEICSSVDLAKQAQFCHQNDPKAFDKVCKTILTNAFNAHVIAVT